MMHRSSTPLLFALLLIFLVACGGGTTPSPIVQPPQDPVQPGGNSISGTVTAPAGGDVSGTIVLACLNSCTPQSPVTQTDATGNYNLADLAPGSYIVIAYKDANNNQTADSGDYIGAYPNAQSPTPVTPPMSGINITMQVEGGSTTPTDPNPAPTEGGSISGTVTSGGDDIAGAFVGACPVVGESADCGNPAAVTQIAQSGSSAAYSLDNVPAGQYLVVAQHDVDGDGTLDYEGFYNQIVTPPASNINIQLVVAGTASLSVSGMNEFSLFNPTEIQGLLE